MGLEKIGGDGIRTHEPLKERITHLLLLVILSVGTPHQFGSSAAFDQALRDLGVVSLPLHFSGAIHALRSKPS